MAKTQRRSTKEFEEEAVRLVETSGRTQREIAEDLGVGLWTLRRWIDKRRDALMESPPPDRGSQYRSLDYQAELRRHGVLVRRGYQGSRPLERRVVPP